LVYGQPLTEGAEKERRDITEGEERTKPWMPFAKSKGDFRIHNVQSQKKEENMVGEGIDFINFIIDALDNQSLMQEALGKETPKELYDFFQEKRYYDVSFTDCVSILKAKKAVVGKGVNNANIAVNLGEAGQPPPPGY